MTEINALTVSEAIRQLQVIQDQYGPDVKVCFMDYESNIHILATGIDVCFKQSLSPYALFHQDTRGPSNQPRIESEAGSKEDSIKPAKGS